MSSRQVRRSPTYRKWRSAILVLTTLVASGQPSFAQRPETSLAGEWKLEFRSEANPADPEARSAPWLTFNATLVQVDSAVGGAMRSSGPSGQFGCKRRGDNVCSAGRMRLSWDEQDWQLFEFRLTPGSADKGTGRAEIRFSTGETDRYTFVMSRVR